MTSYVKFKITNNSQQHDPSSGLANEDIYLFFTEGKNTVWKIDPASGIAAVIPDPGQVPSITLAQLVTAGGCILVDSGSSIASARIYFSNNEGAVTLENNILVTPTPGLADYYYDFFEFALSGSDASPPVAGTLNIDTTQVDQLGIPFTLQVTPEDPDFSAGSGIVPALDRQTLISRFQAMAVGSLSAFADCVVPGSRAGVPYCLLNPGKVLSNQLQATALTGDLVIAGTAGAWEATFTITSGSPPDSNGALQAGMLVSSPLLPAGTTVSSLPDTPTGHTVVMRSSAQENPFLSGSSVVLYFLAPPASALASYFDQAIDAFFQHYMNSPLPLLEIEQNNGGDHIYTGKVVEVEDIPGLDGRKHSYTVLQFTGGSDEVYDIYYPFFSTNSAAGKTTPSGRPVPPPPVWWAPDLGLMYYAPPSLMVFGASGVFADNTQRQAYMPDGSSSTVLAAIENVVVTALARGSATSWQFMKGTISPDSDARKAQVTLSEGSTADLQEQMYMASFQIANIPMTVSSITSDTAVTVSSPLEILPTIPDLLTFSLFYPGGGTWSAYARFLHDPAISIDGRAYALPFDDQGGFSSDLNAANSIQAPACASITLGPWTPAGSHSSPPGPPVTNQIRLSWQANDNYLFVFLLMYDSKGIYVKTCVEVWCPISSFNGRNHALPLELQAQTSPGRQATIQMKQVSLDGTYNAAVWCRIQVPGFIFEGSAFEFSFQYDGPAAVTIW